MPEGGKPYADDGFQADGQPRYPIDTPEHVRAAWAYINVADNAAKYSPEQLEAIKSRIRAAAQKFGIEIAASAEPPPEPPPSPEPQAPAASGAFSSPAPVTAAEAAARIHAAATRTTHPTRKEGAGLMNLDPAKIREGLGLAPDAPDDEVKAALVTAGLAATPAVPAPAPNPALVHAAGTMTIDVSAWAEQQDRIKRLEAQAAQQQRNERDKVIAEAVQDGKFAPARKDHWVRLWDADPEGTRQLLDSLAGNVVPVMAMGYAGDRDGEDIDQEFAHLFPPVGKGA